MPKTVFEYLIKFTVMPLLSLFPVNLPQTDLMETQKQ